MDFAEQIENTDTNQTVTEQSMSSKPAKSMGLKRRSISLPKLFTRSKETTGNQINIGNVIPNSVLVECQEKSDLIQVCSGTELDSEVRTTTSTKQPIYDRQSDIINAAVVKLETNQSKELHLKNKTTRPGFSDRLKGLFNSVFNPDRHGKNFTADFNSSLPSRKNDSMSKDDSLLRQCKSLPDLNQRVQQQPPQLKTKLFRRRRSFLSNLARKAKYRQGRDDEKRKSIERDNSNSSSLNQSTSCESSPDVSWSSTKRNLVNGSTSKTTDSHRQKYITSNDSVSSSPANSSDRIFFDETPDSSPNMLQREKSEDQVACQKDQKRSNDNYAGKFLQNNIKHPSPSALRKNASRRRNYDVSSLSNSRRKREGFLSYTSPDTHSNDDTTCGNNVISNASLAAQRKRRIFASRRAKSCENSDHVVNENIHEIFRKSTMDATITTNEREGANSTFTEKQNRVIRNIMRKELDKSLRDKVFHPKDTRHWCRDISESIKSKMEMMTGGVFKIIVQVFIGAVEDEGISTATQCSLGQRTDNFTVASYRQDTLFAIASVLAIDFKEVSAQTGLEVKSFQNRLYSRIHGTPQDKKNVGIKSTIV
eukprot:gene17681-19445_t